MNRFLVSARQRGSTACFAASTQPSSSSSYSHSYSSSSFSSSLLFGSSSSDNLASIRPATSSYYLNTTTRHLAKAAKGSKKSSKKGGKNNKASSEGDDDDEDDDDNEEVVVAVVLPDPKATDGAMDGALRRLAAEFSKLKAGAASADMFNDVTVDGYGALSNAGQVTVKSPTKIVVAVYDPSVSTLVADAIRKFTQNRLNPTVEGSLVNITVPKPSQESRDTVIKMLSKLGDKSKTEIRNHRKHTMDELKKASKGSGVSEDAVKKVRFAKH
jgi:ribosome recycling factor